MSRGEQVAVDPGFAVLFVCTGNRCRWPLAENLFRAMLRHVDASWTVASAGTRALGGEPMHPHSATVLAERDAGAVGWTSTRLTGDAIVAADLVLTTEVAERKAVVIEQPAAVRRSFTILEFAQLVMLGRDISAADNALDRAAGLDLIRSAHVARSLPQARQNRLIDIADPLGDPIEAFRRTADTIEGALKAMMNVLRPSVTAASSPSD